MTSDTLLIERTPEGIVTLTINRPDASNALDWATQNAFLKAMKSLVANPSVRVLIVTGAGRKAFCAGGDLVELVNYASESDGARLAAIMSEALDLREAAPFPSIAAINGHALGGGSEMAVACDIRVMRHGAKLGFVQLGLGLTPGWGAGQRLLRLVGYSLAMELLLRAEAIPAEEMLAYGVVNQVADDAYAAAMNLARRIADWDAAAVMAVKQVLRNGLTMSSGEARAAERDIFPKLWAAEAHLNAVNDFLNRKKTTNG